MHTMSSKLIDFMAFGRLIRFSAGVAAGRGSGFATVWVANSYQDARAVAS